MVYPGPWQESRIHEEIFTLKDSSATDRTIELLGDAPTVRSGWDANNLAALGWHAIGSGNGSYEQPLADPPEAKTELSEAGFAAMLADLVGDGSTMQHRLQQSGDQIVLGPPTTWHQTQTWEARGVGYRVWHDRDLNNNTGSAIYAIPAGMDNATDEYYVELETLGAYSPVEIVEATVLASPVTSDYRLFVKDAHPTDAAPFLRSAVVQGGAASSMADVRDFFPAADADLPLDHATLNDLSRTGTPANGTDWSADGRMPALAVLYDGPDLSVATLNGDVGYDQTHDGQPVRIRIRYRWPRWRKVYYEPQTVAIRQTTHRDDHLAGGAYQTWPVPTSRQLSNTTFGGYL